MSAVSPYRPDRNADANAEAGTVGAAPDTADTTGDTRMHAHAGTRIGTAAFDLTGRLALVTGSSRGIGRTLAQGLAEAGATVLVHGRSLPGAQRAAAQIARECDRPAHAVAFDLTDEHAVSDGVARLTASWGTPDILVNNAGVQRRAPITAFTTSDWNDLVATNLTGMFFVTRAIARDMVERGSGKIVQIGSIQSQLARPSITPYSATKGAVVMFTKGLCADLAGYGIQANAVAPGYFATDLTRALVDDREFSAWVAGRTPAGRWGDTRDLIGAVVFLASSASDFVNGQTLYVDGGMSAVV